MSNDVDIIIVFILPWLLQRSKKYRGHCSTIYHTTLQWVMGSDPILLLVQCEKCVRFKFYHGCLKDQINHTVIIL